MRWAETEGREGRPADLTGMDLRQVQKLAHRMLTALIAPGVQFYGMDLQGASLQGSNLSGADLRSANLRGADLRGVNFSGAKLNHADLRDTKMGPLMISAGRLLPARLDNAAARYADFRGADLKRVRLSGSGPVLRQPHGRRSFRLRNGRLRYVRRKTADALCGFFGRQRLVFWAHRFI